MNRKKLLIVLLLVALIAAYVVFDIGRFLSLAYLKQSQASFAIVFAEKPEVAPFV